MLSTFLKVKPLEYFNYIMKTSHIDYVKRIMTKSTYSDCYDTKCIGVDLTNLLKTENDPFDSKLYNLIHSEYNYYYTCYNNLVILIICNKDNIKWCEENIRFINTHYYIKTVLT